MKDSSNKQFYWVLKADNNEIIATSETYTTKQSCEDGIAAVKRSVPIASIVDETNSKRIYVTFG
ncbi:MAG: YegP family protein [Candidatus Bathyarchaeota archaeon]|nr:YegP family protein [Candidatus Bathyarchaeota archaeon]